ncbi:FeoA family protein [Gloeothece citriformis PCC 7424]|uniref:FeoA family protein n=1 Tax=Gloeothece citriformis (strain PCC 7424) TaxID=65393 RepID=B7KGP4_GLOC7|nr:FeoA family protein [Gloeothece citriformis]ACK71971.1 FeoA family protein [Gloeothece citriformis PCC 7424]
MMTLSKLKTGEKAIVAPWQTSDNTLIRKLMTMGIMPGVAIKLEQQFPSFIVQVGRTRAAFDRETAKLIYVERG